MSRIFQRVSLCALVAALAVGCGKDEPPSKGAVNALQGPPPPHGGTPVVLSDDFKMEWVRTPAAGTLQAYFMDDDMENFVRLSAPSFDATIGGRPMIFKAVANHATGETVGDSAMFETQNDWLKTNAAFEIVIKKVTVHDDDFEDVTFKFPSGEKVETPAK